METPHWSYRVVLHGTPLPDKPDGNVVVLHECVSRREALGWLRGEVRRLREQGSWDVMGSARSGYAVVAMDRADSWFRMHIMAED